MLYLIPLAQLALFTASVLLLRFGLRSTGARRIVGLALSVALLLPVSTSGARNVAISSAIEFNRFDLLAETTATVPTQSFERETPDGGSETFTAFVLYPDRLIRHGVYTNRSRDGITRFESHHVFGHTHGPYKRYYTDGSLQAAGEVLAGKPEGEWTFYYPDGNIEATGLFASGKPIDLWVYHDSQTGETRTMGYIEQRLLPLSELPGTE